MCSSDVGHCHWTNGSGRMAAIAEEQDSWMQGPGVSPGVGKKDSTRLAMSHDVSLESTSLQISESTVKMKPSSSATAKANQHLSRPSCTFAFFAPTTWIVIKLQSTQIRRCKCAVAAPRISQQRSLREDKTGRPIDIYLGARLSKVQSIVL
jgi:hypothetical protein